MDTCNSLWVCGIAYAVHVYAYKVHMCIWYLYTNIYLYVATWERSTAYMENKSSLDILHVVAKELHDNVYIIQVNVVIIYVTVVDVSTYV
jgi:hypothetical protein